MTVAAGPADGYLADARAAGLLHHVGELPLVAGLHEDRPGGESQALVEFCDPGLLAGNADAVVAAVRTALPTADVLVLRAPGQHELQPPWHPHLTYIRYAGSGPAPAPEGIAVRRSAPEHDPLIRDWLIRAFAAYGAEQGHPAEHAELAATAGDVLAAPGRLSWVAFVDGRPAGHVTLLDDSYDDVTARRHVELLDSLVDAEPPLRTDVLAALTAAAVAHADDAGLPLLGHVVHPAGDDSRARAILASLHRRGWVVDHRYWRRPYPPAT